MKRKRMILMLVAIVAALIIGAGSFVYTALTNTATVTITGGGTEFATVTSAGYAWTTRPTGNRVGAVEGGNLFSVARDSDYTGDLVFTVIITNVDELVGNYVYLNLQLKTTDATPSDAATEWLTIEEAVAEFIVPAVNPSPFTVKINDGTYRTEKNKNPSVTPVFHIRVRQR